MAGGADLDWDAAARRCSHSRCLDSACEGRGQRSNKFLFTFKQIPFMLQLSTVLIISLKRLDRN